ncbi:energy transducer TonB [Thalassobellus suaedae]|uniref:Energy transducer TonB n=1 Tax=Thalassobellus suaedae TaxID=3074124 RepID=A0ABY9XYQ2_9FLAO|nr:energy transducer TonB [Flavobacteriaceae bacterium HL-DH10]
MKYIYTLLIILISSSIIAQENEIKENPELVFEVIENVPVYKGCDKTLSNAEIKKCMSYKISELISKNFNIRIANKIGLPNGLVKINVIFKIDKHGKVTEISSRAPHPELEKEAIRVIKLIPDMERPGIQRGKPVTVPYSLPINFMVDNSSKKSRKKKN